MKKTNWPYICIFLLLLTTIVYSQKKKLPVKSNANPTLMKNATLDTPVFYYRAIIDASKLGGALDTINLILNDLGVSMSVEQARTYRQTAMRQLSKIIPNLTLDSVKTK
jgi:hypothetical protein